MTYSKLGVGFKKEKVTKMRNLFKKWNLFLTRDKRTPFREGEGGAYLTYCHFIGTVWSERDYYKKKVRLYDVMTKRYQIEEVLLKQVKVDRKLKMISVEVVDGVL
jgi:hypothetical protein